VSEEGQRQLAEKAARIGAELFVMDDGWFGARDNGSRRSRRLGGQSPEVPARVAAADRAVKSWG